MIPEGVDTSLSFILHFPKTNGATLLFPFIYSFDIRLFKSFVKIEVTLAYKTLYSFRGQVLTSSKGVPTLCTTQVVTTNISLHPP